MDKTNEKTSEKKHANTPIRTGIGSGIGWILGMVVILIAFPFAFLYGMLKPGKFLTVEAPMASREIATVEIDVKNEFVPADRFNSFFIGDTKRLIVSLHSKERVIKRSVRTAGAVGFKGRDAETRRDLEDFTPELAKQLNVAWNFDEAVKLSCKEIDGQVTIKSQKPVQVATPVAAPSNSTVPQAAAVSQEPVKARSQVEFSNAGTGKVIRAGEVKVKPNGKAPYTTFEVVLKSKTNQEFRFTGVDLEEKITNGVFKRGDVVSITRGPKISTEKEIDGKQFVTQKNTFLVDMVQSS